MGAEGGTGLGLAHESLRPARRITQP